LAQCLNRSNYAHRIAIAGRGRFAIAIKRAFRHAETAATPTLVRNAGKYLGEFLLALNPLQASNLRHKLSGF